MNAPKYQHIVTNNDRLKPSEVMYINPKYPPTFLPQIQIAKPKKAGLRFRKR